MEQRQRLRHLDASGMSYQLHKSLDDPTAQDPHRIITPPEDFQDPPVDSQQPPTILLEPPVMFRPSTSSTGRERPKTDIFWTSTDEHASSRALPEEKMSFNEELERLKCHSLFLRFPRDGSGRRVVQYRSSRSVVAEYSNQYR